MKENSTFLRFIILMLMLAWLAFIALATRAQDAPPNPTACVPGYVDIYSQDGYGYPVVSYHVPKTCGYIERDRSLDGYLSLGQIVIVDLRLSDGFGHTGTAQAEIVGYQFTYYPDAYPNTLRQPVIYFLRLEGREFGAAPERITS